MGDAPHIHDHDHGHDHPHDHVHGHGQRHDHVPHAEPAPAPVSLLRMSAAQRLALSGGAVAAIWLGVFWAMS